MSVFPRDRTEPRIRHRKPVLELESVYQQTEVTYHYELDHV